MEVPPSQVSRPGPTAWTPCWNRDRADEGAAAPPHRVIKVQAEPQAGLRGDSRGLQAGSAPWAQSGLQYCWVSPHPAPAKPGELQRCCAGAELGLQPAQHLVPRQSLPAPAHPHERAGQAHAAAVAPHSPEAAAPAASPADTKKRKGRRPLCPDPPPPPPPRSAAPTQPEPHAACHHPGPNARPRGSPSAASHAGTRGFLDASRAEPGAAFAPRWRSPGPRAPRCPRTPQTAALRGRIPEMRGCTGDRAASEPLFGESRSL